MADKQWEEGVGRVTGMYQRKITGVADPSRYHDTLIEVLDPRSGTIISTVRFDEELRFVGESNYVTNYHEDEEGFPHVRIWKLNFYLNRE